MTEPTEPPVHRRKLSFSINRLNVLGIVAIVLAATLIGVHNLRHDNSPNQLLNVSYDPTRELYAALDKTFVDQFSVPYTPTIVFFVQKDKPFPMRTKNSRPRPSLFVTPMRCAVSTKPANRSQLSLSPATESRKAITTSCKHGVRESGRTLVQ